MTVDPITAQAIAMKAHALGLTVEQLMERWIASTAARVAEDAAQLDAEAIARACRRQ